MGSASESEPPKNAGPEVRSPTPTPPTREGKTPSAPQTAPITIKSTSLEGLRAETPTLPFRARRPNAPCVFADGNPDSGVMIVGEAPGAEEERQERPFVGPAGQLLDLMLASIGLDRTSVYITNLSPWRPVGNRVPNVQEAAELIPLLHRHVSIVEPRFILALGGTSTKALLGTQSGIMRMRGRWETTELEDHKVEVLPTFHPAYLLREPAQKRLAWRDLVAFRSKLEGGTAPTNNR